MFFDTCYERKLNNDRRQVRRPNPGNEAEAPRLTETCFIFCFFEKVEYRIKIARCAGQTLEMRVVGPRFAKTSFEIFLKRVD